MAEEVKKFESKYTSEEIEGKLDKVNQEFTSEEKEKLTTLNNYNDADIQQRITELENNKANKSDVYNKTETDNLITSKVAEIVAGAPEEFNTLKEMSDWLTEHSDSAATMNTAIQANTKAIAGNATAIEANTAEIANNKSDILSAEKAIEINQRSIGIQVSKNLIPQEVEMGFYDDTTGASMSGGSLIRVIGYAKVKPNTEYTISSNLNLFTIWNFNGNVAINRTENIKNNVYTITTPANCDNLRISLASPNVNVSDFEWIQVEEGTVATEYEPYVPSVNERLVEVEDSVSELTPQVEQNKSDILIVNSLVVYCKNLIPQDVAIGYYADSTGAPTENTAFIRAVNYPKVKPNVKYTMSSNLPIYSVWYFDGDTAISRENIKETTRTITIPENCNNIRISLQKPSSSSGTSEFKWLQVEEGEVATEFTPYVPSLQNQINALVERIAAFETAQTQNE